jgi:hypothetical protein
MNVIQAKEKLFYDDLSVLVFEAKNA